MIEWIIRRSVANRFLVMMAALFLSIWGTWTIVHTRWTLCRTSPTYR
ncbi:cobalt-zinc-cadmium resistance protein CzcA [Klebsiella variicola]|nr:cobalt-zinc-cadmium resistance protein CzcA [Klebsiella variicola]